MLLLLLLPLLLLLSLGGSQYSSLYYRLRVPRSVTVEEGLCTSIPCTFSYYSTDKWDPSSPIHGYWFKSSPANSNDVPVATTNPTREVKKWAKGRFHLVGDPVKDNCSLSITDVQRNDSGEYFFRMERGQNKYNYLHYQVLLNVTDLTQKPNISIPVILEAEQPITVKCTATWICAEPTNLTFSWRGDVLSTEKLGRGLPSFSELTFTPRPQDHGTNLTCQVTIPNSGMSTERTVQLNVACPRGATFLTFYLGTFVGAGITAILIFFILLIYKKLQRKKQIERKEVGTTDVQSNNEAKCIKPEMMPELTQNEDIDPSLFPPDTVTKVPPEELNYASLNFRRLKPQDLKDLEAFSEYSEIKY